MSGVDVDRELARLRARAYGPAADIADDPVALARLRELEAAAPPRVSAFAAAPPEAPRVPGAPQVPVDGTFGSPDALPPLTRFDPSAPGAEIASTPALVTAPSRRRRLAATVTVLLATAGAALAGAATIGAELQLGRAVDGAHDATLARAERPVVRYQAERAALDEVVTYADYRGMQVASGTLDGILCIMVLRTVETGVGPPTLACGAPGIAATADLTILSQSAGGARTTSGALAAGTVVRFTLGPGVVHVDVSDAPVDTVT